MICKYCETPRDVAEDCDCHGAMFDKALNLIAALRGRRPITAEDIRAADDLLDDHGVTA